MCPHNVHLLACSLAKSIRRGGQRPSLYSSALFAPAPPCSGGSGAVRRAARCRRSATLSYARSSHALRAPRCPTSVSIAAAGQPGRRAGRRGWWGTAGRCFAVGLHHLWLAGAPRSSGGGGGPGRRSFPAGRLVLPGGGEGGGKALQGGEGGRQADDSWRVGEGGAVQGATADEAHGSMAGCDIRD